MRLLRARPLYIALTATLALAACSGGGSAGAGAPAASSRSSASSGASSAPLSTPAPTPVAGALTTTFFGLHDADPVGASWPKAPVGSLRIWDAGVVWNQVERTPGTYDFSRLDAIVAAATAHHAAPLIVLGQTPVFHSSRPRRVGAYGKGASAMPDLRSWSAYVRAVVSRYAGQASAQRVPGVAFQVWNEANVEGYWSGTQAQMAALTAAAHRVVTTVARGSTLLEPAMATRTLGQRAWLRKFYAQRVAGVPVADLADVVSLQLYPEVGQGPERSAALLTEARRILRLQGVAPDKPVWDTEINYGLQGGAPAPPAAPDQQQANVALTYLLDAGAGVARVFWYAWDLHTIADTDLVRADNVTPTPAGAAFSTVQRWLVGSKVTGCSAVAAGAGAGTGTGAAGTWTCSLVTSQGPATVFWNGRRTTSVSTVFDAGSAEVLGQPATALPLGGSTVEVGALPVLVRSGQAGERAGGSLPPLP